MRKCKKQVVFLFVLCALLLLSQPGLGIESNEAEAHELIVLFDTSTSMAWNDTGFLAPDALRQIVSILPSDWRVGLVTFRADVIDVVPPGIGTQAEITAILDGVRYTNFTNSGAGFQQALALFSDDAQSRTILFVTDGEMAHLPTSAATAEAMALAGEMIDQIIDSDIQVHTISIGRDFWATHEAILGLAQATGGTLFQDVRSEELSEVASTLVFDVLGVARSQVGAAQIVDSVGNFMIRLPAVGLDSARVLLTAEAPIDHIVVSGNGSNVGIQRGQRFAIVEVDRPIDDTIHIEFTAVGASHASLILEWDLQLMAETQHDGLTRVWLADRTGEAIRLDPLSSTQFFPIETQMWDATTEEAIQAWQRHLEALGINTPDFDFQEVVIPMPPAVEDEPEVCSAPLPLSPVVVTSPSPSDNSSPVPGSGRGAPPVFAIIILSLALILLLLVFVFRFRSKGSVELPPIQEFDRRFAFTGKLDLYVSLISGDDTGAQTSYVVRLGKSRPLSLRAILRKCRVPGNFLGADQIYFAADKEGALQVVNDSDVSIFVGSNTLCEKQSHTLSHGERVRVRDEEESRELVISPRFLYRLRSAPK